MPEPALLFASLLFGLVGLLAFRFGKRNANWAQLLIGIALMVFPYFVSSLVLSYLIGAALCLALYLWRD
ncbi:hypothetical protein [Uliginosibacterium sediminicola]|uniref:Amino acid transport protein n=1 Tax=Uliginosibacterium sediminicola TaxID=2024550 RepID=A0ABU9YWD5_9RHOO